MAKTSQLSQNVGINANNRYVGDGTDEKTQKLTPAVHGPDSHRNFYLRIRHFCPLVSPTPSRAPSYLCGVADKSGIRPQKNGGSASLNHRKSPDPEDETRTSAHFPLAYIHPASPFVSVRRPAPAADSIPASAIFHREHDCLWPTGDGGAAEGRAVCAPPRRLLGKEEAAAGKCDAG